MKDLTGQEDQVTSLPADDWNDQAQEFKNIVETIVATMTSGDADQFGKALANYAAASFFTGGGAADVQTAVKIGDKQALSQLAAITDGYLVRFRPSVANATATPTLNVNSLGAKTVVREDASALSAGDLDTVRDALVRWDQAGDQWRLLNAALSAEGDPVPSRGSIDGFITRFEDVNDIEIGVGIARDSTDTKTMKRTSVITKQNDADWAEGDNAGGFPSGLTLLADTWYHVFIIRKTSDGSIDAGFDTSFTAANLLADATGYSEFLWIWSVKTNATGDPAFNFKDYDQFDDECWWRESTQDVLATDPGTSEVSHTLSEVPPSQVSGQITAILTFLFREASPVGTASYVYGHGDSVLTAPDATHRDAKTSTNDEAMAVGTRVRTNASQVVKTIQDRSVGDSTISIEVKGFVHPRGKNI